MHEACKALFVGRLNCPALLVLLARAGHSGTGVLPQNNDGEHCTEGEIITGWFREIHEEHQELPGFVDNRTFVKEVVALPANCAVDFGTGPLSVGDLMPNVNWGF